MIIRAENRKTFTVISNELINDHSISDKALGTLVRLLSNADHWNLNVNYMVKTGKQGRTAVRSSIAELEKAGYIHRQVVRNKAGRITGTESLIYEQAVAKVKGVSSNLRSPEQMSRQVSPDLGHHMTHEEAPEEDIISPVKTTPEDKVQCPETCPTENNPVINTNIEQRRMETTTTTPDPEPDPVVEVVEEPSQSFPATEDINSLLDLIPKQHRQPMVISLVNQAVKDYTPREMEEAITYASANVRGGWMQYKAFLDKSLKGKWAAGYLESMQDQNIASDVSSPKSFAGAMPAGRFPNGTVTGCARMDSNYQAAAEFLARRRARHDQ